MMTRHLSIKIVNNINDQAKEIENMKQATQVWKTVHANT
jgi:hypothetical protein